MKRREQRLLEETLAESEEYLAFETNLERRALGEYLRQLWLRTLTRVSAVAATLAIIAGASWMIGGAKQKGEIGSVSQISNVAAPTKGVTASTAEREASGRSKVLSDEQLLALFPPNSCFLAEVDGKTILVFRDPALQERYME